MAEEENEKLRAELDSFRENKNKENESLQKELEDLRRKMLVSNQWSLEVGCSNKRQVYVCVLKWMRSPCSQVL